MSAIVNAVSFVANLLQIGAAGIAIYLFLFKRQTIRSVLSLLLNYAFQATLSELKSKLERLNDLSASDPEEKDEIVNVMGDIVGQLCGNPTLAQKCPKLIRRTAAYVDKPQTLTEPRKRGLVSELRETIRNADVQNYDKLIKGQP